MTCIRSIFRLGYEEYDFSDFKQYLRRILPSILNVLPDMTDPSTEETYKLYGHSYPTCL